MKYSVLMSVYKNDNPEYLKLALESIYDNQTKKPDEIVVVFDGPISEDLHNVLNRFREGKESFVKYYPQSENRGLGEALRIGSEYCTGDYIFRMDSDDISVEDRFEIQAKYVEEHPELDVVGGDIAEFKQSIGEKKMRKRVCFANHKDIIEMGKKRNPMNHVTICIKKESLFKAGGYLPLRYVEDYYLWIRMIAKGLILGNINKTMVFVRVGDGFTSRRGNREQIKSWKVIQDYMLSHDMVTIKEAKRNMRYIRVFVRTPSWIKSFFYRFVLRK